MKKIFFTLIILNLLFVVIVTAQNKKQKAFYFCDETKDTLTISELEKCFLQSTTDKGIKVTGYTVLYLRGGNLREFQMSGNKFTRDIYTAVKGDAYTAKATISNIKYTKDGKGYVYKDNVLLFIKKG